MAEASSNSRVDAVLRAVSPDMDTEMIDETLGSEEGCDCQSQRRCDVHTASETDPEDGTGEACSTKSLSGDISENVFENGRRYCNENYFLPNDDRELTRQNILHQMHLILLDGEPTVTPLPPNITRILDIGAGSGDWAVSMAEQHPDAEVIATDVNIFDSDLVSIAPPNVFFQIDDAAEEWTYHEPFDFVHARHLSRAIADWPTFYAQAYRHLNPGGVIHVAESDIASESLRIPNDHPNSYLTIYSSALRNAYEIAGIPRGVGHVSSGSLAAAGFTNIRVFDIEVPIGTWPTDAQGKTLGKMALIVMLETLEAMSIRPLTKYAGFSVEDVLQLCEKVKMEVANWQGATGTIRFAVAMKPT